MESLQYDDKQGNRQCMGIVLKHNTEPTKHPQDDMTSNIGSKQIITEDQ
jgi:hypothetical protein